MNFPGTIRRVRYILFIVLAVCFGAALAGHDIPVDRSLKRYNGMVTALGPADAEGHIYSFKAKPLPEAPGYTPRELRGWRMTVLAGKRFAAVFEVQDNSEHEITVSRTDGPINGVEIKDLFVIEEIRVAR
jgi:hypothetical protein